MRKRVIRSIAVIAVLVTAGALLADPATATATTNHTMTQARNYIVGKWTSGPTAATNWQRIQITGSHKDPCFNYYDIDDVMHQYPNPALATNAAPVRAPYKLRNPSDTAASCPVSARTGGVMVNGQGVVLASWFNPFSWDWGHILSSFWNTVWNDCLSGAAAGVVGTASGTTIVNLLARGGKLFVGPEGYAAIAIGGCVAQMLF